MGGAGDAPEKQGSVLLELSAADDLLGFRRAVEEEGLNVDLTASWYGRWGRKMGLELRTPLMIAATYGSTAVLEYILGTGAADVNRVCGFDGSTALHCAAAGGSPSAADVVKMLVDASAALGAVDALGNTPGDVIPRQLTSGLSAKTKLLKTMLKGAGGGDTTEKEEESPTKRDEKKGEKKEYPPDLTLPDIKNGIYSTDEFRMYTFKVKPCSRAYSHDWTECPFVHPGENARRRDPRKYHYSCVPCPEFRKGSCRNGDACEYAHGVFECWLHPAQYRTRLCKDETGCTRRVCFFAHKAEELRPLYPSGAPASPASSVLPSPRTPALPPLDVATAALLLNQPVTPSTSSSAMASAAVWLNQASGVTTPTMQLPTSRLKTSLSARNLGIDMDLVALEGYQQQLLDDYIANLSSPSSRKSTYAGASTALSSTDYGDMLGSLESTSLLSQLQGLSLRQSATAGSGASQFQSPSGIQILSGYSSSNLPSSPSMRASLSSLSSSSSSSFGLDHSLATAIMNSKASAFARRSQSFCDRGGINRPSGLGVTSLAAAAAPAGPTLSDWGSPDGKLDWGIQGEELNKLRKCASFGFRSNGSSAGAATAASMEEPDVSWVQSLVKDGPAGIGAEQKQRQYQVNKGNEYNAAEMLSPWMEQLYSEQEQMVA